MHNTLVYIYIYVLTRDLSVRVYTHARVAHAYTIYMQPVHQPLCMALLVPVPMVVVCTNVHACMHACMHTYIHRQTDR